MRATAWGAGSRLRTMSEPVRIAVLNDYELVVAGVAAMLQPYADRVAVVELDVRSPVTGDVDVVLYDSFGQAQADTLDVTALVPSGARIVVYSWNADEALVAAATRAGVHGYVRKGASAEELVEVIEQVHAGQRVARTGVAGREDVGRWPGQSEGLTAREAEVLALICQGMSNEEIGRRAFLGINTIKTHIRHLYRKIGATSRSQAVIWGMQRGFGLPESEHVRQD
jgi:two-component system, NarL family, response regulator LiaR